MEVMESVTPLDILPADEITNMDTNIALNCELGDSSGRKRQRDTLVPSAFGADIESDGEDKNKLPKRSEAELPTRAERNENPPVETRNTSLDDIFDTGDADDYENSVDRAKRLSYLTATGSKPRRSAQYNENASFQDSTSHRQPIDHEKHLRIPTSISSMWTTSVKYTSRSRLEQQEFVKDSVQSKLSREAASAIKPKPSKSLDFTAFFQKVSDRKEQIKLVTAEQVGLASLQADDELEEEEGEEFDESLKDENEEIDISIDEGDISIEDDGDEIEPLQSKADEPKKTSMGPPAPVTASSTRPLGRSKLMILEDEDEEHTMNLAPHRQPIQASAATFKAQHQDSDHVSPVLRPTISLDDFELDEEEKSEVPTTIERPSLTQTLALEMEADPNEIDENSQTSVTESSLKLELVPTLEMAPDLPKTTPGGMKLTNQSTASTNRPSLLSQWLSGIATTTTTKKGESKNCKKVSSVPSAPSITAPSLSEKTRSKFMTKKQKSGISEKDTSILPDILNENAMTGEEDVPAHSRNKNTNRLKKTRQLFDDEAENGIGSDVDEADRETEGAQFSNGAGNGDDDEDEEGGSSQDEYEVDDTNDSKRKSPLDDIFETDDRAIIRSLVMKQELERERAEAERLEQMALRRDRRSRRIEEQLHAEAHMLLEDRKMEERLAARREQRREKKRGLGAGMDEEVLVDVHSASLPIPTSVSSKDWFMDDDDDDDADEENAGDGSNGGRGSEAMERERRRLEILADQQSRRKLATSAQFLLQDENSQSILQIIERANTQHSQPSISSIHDSPYDEASQDAFSLGGFFDRAATASPYANTSASNISNSAGAATAVSSGAQGSISSTFSASSVEHLAKLRQTFKGSNTQLASTALLFTRSHHNAESSENSQDGLRVSDSASSGASNSRSGLQRSRSSIGPKKK